MNRPKLLVRPFSIVGNVPSVVYLRVHPKGISTFTVMLDLNIVDPSFTIGASNCAVPKVAEVLALPGVGVSVFANLLHHP